jgi:hypothetical protein
MTEVGNVCGLRYTKEVSVLVPKTFECLGKRAYTAKFHIKSLQRKSQTKSFAPSASLGGRLGCRGARSAHGGDIMCCLC